MDDEQYKNLLFAWIARNPEKRRIEYNEEPSGNDYVMPTLIAYDFSLGVRVVATSGAKVGVDADPIKADLFKRIALMLNLA